MGKRKYNSENVPKIIKNYGGTWLDKVYKNSKQQLNIRCNCGNEFKRSMEKINARKSATCIEYDGEFHYIINKRMGGVDKLISTKIRDTIKNDYCRRNNINLIRIPYWDYNKIETILIENKIIPSQAR